MEWTLEYDGETKTFEEWGLGPPARTLISQGIDTVQFAQPGASFTVAAQFATGGTATIYRDGVRWFFGRFRSPRRHGDSKSEGYSWKLEGPWRWLDRIIFRQVWKFYVDGVLTDWATSRLMLGQKIADDGFTLEYQNTGVQIQEVAAWAIAHGAPMQLDTADLPAVPFPALEVKNAFCGECIVKMMQFSPDAVTWFDYSTSPPTLKIKRRASLVPVTLSQTGGTVIRSGEITPRDDLQAAGVVIEYETTSTVNGFQNRVVTYDIQPDGVTTYDGETPASIIVTPAPLVLASEADVIQQTVTLEGGNISYASASIVCEAIDHGSAAWWTARQPQLAHASVRGLVITPVTRTGVLANELKNGNHATWMGGTVVEEEIKATASYDRYSTLADGVTEILDERVVNEPLSVMIRTTSLSTNTYQSAASGTLAEPQPVGMAQAIYSAVRVLHYDGQIELEEEEVTGSVGIGNTLNLSGGEAALETMNAVVQRVVEECGNGTTQITFGPPKHMGPDDIMEYLRMLRYRTRFIPFASRASGRGGSVSQVDFASNVPRQVNSVAQSTRPVQTWSDPAAPTATQFRAAIDMRDLTNVSGLTATQTGDIRLRQITVCDNGVERKMIVLASAIFD
jgi:hypothetical protein